MISVVCPNCNKNVWLEEEQLLCFCTYCGNSIVVPTDSAQVENTNGIKTILEKALLALEEVSIDKCDAIEQAKRIASAGLLLDSDNQNLIFMMILLTANCYYTNSFYSLRPVRLSDTDSSYAEKYFKVSGDAFTADEKEILERTMRVDPYFSERLLYLCFEYNAMEKINFLLKKYPYMFTKERLISRGNAKLFKRKDYVEFLLKQGVVIDEIFSVYMQELEPISYKTEEVKFKESTLPLDVFRMYLDLGLDVNYIVEVEEIYEVFLNERERTKTIEKNMDLYEFFAIFEKAKEQEDYHKEYKLLYKEVFQTFNKGKSGRGFGLCYYYYEYKNNNYTDYMAALVEHGYVPKPKPEKEAPKRKRRFPWF